MASLGDILKALLYGVAVWKKVGEPVYTTYKQSQNVHKCSKIYAAQLKDMGIDTSSLQDEVYLDSLTQEQRTAVLRYYEKDVELQYELGEIQEKFCAHLCQSEKMQAAEYQLRSSGIDIAAIKNCAYRDSLTIKQREMVDTYRRMQLHYLNINHQKDFDDAADRLDRVYGEISED